MAEEAKTVAPTEQTPPMTKEQREELMRKATDELVCKLFSVTDSDAVSKDALRKKLMQQHILIMQLTRSNGMLHTELYCEKPDHEIFKNQPKEAIEMAEQERQRRCKGKIIIPKIVLGKG
jgi:hypothetical protein